MGLREHFEGALPSTEIGGARRIPGRAKRSAARRDKRSVRRQPVAHHARGASVTILQRHNFSAARNSPRENERAAILEAIKEGGSLFGSVRNRAWYCRVGSWRIGTVMNVPVEAFITYCSREKDHATMPLPALQRYKSQRIR